jgi:DedD protein
MADAADLNVDELRRRARRRLVGAIVLALAAAVLVPMLLESDPKPLGESVAVKIPPVDEGKFVNRLNETAPKTDATRKDGSSIDGGARKETSTEGGTRKSIPDAEKAVMAPGAKAPKYDTQLGTEKAAPAAAAPAPASPAGSPAAPPAAPPSAPLTAPPPASPTVSPAASSAAPVAPEVKPEAKSATHTETKTPSAPGKAETRPERKAESRVEPRAETKVETKAEASNPAAPNGPTKEGFSVQLAAFSDDKGAGALAGRLKRAGYPAYTEPLKTSRGTLWRVRVGPYPSRDSANGVRDKLKAEGQNGIVAPSR